MVEKESEICRSEAGGEKMRPFGLETLLTWEERQLEGGGNEVGGKLLS